MKTILPRLILRLAALSVCVLLFSGCATKLEPIYFPEAPAPPRVQLLTQFNSSSTLRANDFVTFLTGDDLSGGFGKAFGLAFHDGRLYVADAGKTAPGIALVDFGKKTIERVGSGFSKPMNITVDNDGTVYICDISEDMAPGVVVLDSQNRFVRRFTIDVENFRPAASLVIGERLYVADVLKNVIHVLDKHSGALLNTFGKEDRLGWPVHLAQTPDGEILITETGAQTLRLYNQEGVALARIGEPGDRAGTFSRPKATAVDRNGLIYVVDVAFQNVQILDKKGTALMYFGSRPGKPDSLIMPAGIAITYDRMDVFQKYAAADFTLEYVIAVSSQGAPNAGSKVTLYGFGKIAGADYTVPGQ